MKRITLIIITIGIILIGSAAVILADTNERSDRTIAEADAFIEKVDTNEHNSCYWMFCDYEKCLSDINRTENRMERHNADSNHDVEESSHWTFIEDRQQDNSYYMGVHTITDVESEQYHWLSSHDWTYDPEGICTYNGRILIAVTPVYGQIGDYIDFRMDDGSTLECTICDYKQSDRLYGHLTSEGKLNIIELIVSPDWYECDHPNKKYGSVIAYRNQSEIFLNNEYENSY